MSGQDTQQGLTPSEASPLKSKLHLRHCYSRREHNKPDTARDNCCSEVATGREIAECCDDVQTGELLDGDGAGVDGVGEGQGNRHHPREASG